MKRLALMAAAVGLDEVRGDHRVVHDGSELDATGREQLGAGLVVVDGQLGVG